MSKLQEAIQFLANRMQVAFTQGNYEVAHEFSRIIDLLKEIGEGE
jgi:hypothetical protein